MMKVLQDGANLTQWRAGGERTGRRPRASKAGGYPRVKLQKLKFCI